MGDMSHFTHNHESLLPQTIYDKRYMFQEPLINYFETPRDDIEYDLENVSQCIKVCLTVYWQL